MPDTTEVQLRRVCVFGGSFDPPHMCHVMAAVWALQTRPIDEVWWVPTWDHAFGKRLQPYANRRKMIEASIAPFGASMQLNDVERELDGTSRTWKTLEVLRAAHVDCEFSLLVGADLIDEFATWENAALIAESTVLHVVGREGYQDPAEEELRLPDISSTALRRAIGEGRRSYYRPRLSRPVADLIEENGWYSMTVPS